MCDLSTRRLQPCVLISNQFESFPFFIFCSLYNL
nr:MAG TPA: hypothetical protein [Caudoviricetes sp.]